VGATHPKEVVVRRIRLFAIASVAAIAVVATAAVISQARKSYEVDATALAATVKSSGSVSIVAGYVTGKPFKKSAAILRNKATNNPDGTATTTGKFTVYNKRGSVSGTAEGKVTPTTGGNATFEGTGEFTSGTGRYEDASGEVNLTGTYNSGTGVLTLKATGSVKY
jgi:hypothetical protein